MKKIVKMMLVMVVMIVTITSCGTIKGAVTVSPDYYVTDIEGYQLIFKDTQGKVLNAIRGKETIGTEFVTVKKIVKRNGEDWQVTTKLEDALVAVSYQSVSDLKDAMVIKIPLSKIEIYTREVK